MKKLLFIASVGLLFSFNGISQTKTFGKWKVVQDEYTDLITLETNIIKPAWTRCKIFMSIEKSGTMSFLLKEQGSNYQEFSTEQLYRIGWVDAYITINGKKEKKGTIVQGGLASAVSDWVTLFKKGTKGALKYESIGNYYEFSLSGFPQAYEYYMKIKHGIDIKKREAEEKRREKERQERLLEEKRKEELLEQKRQEIIPLIEAKIPNQILEASELWIENQNILEPLDADRRYLLHQIEKGLINHFSEDTVSIRLLSATSIDNDYLDSLKQGNHSIKGNLNENDYYPFSEEFYKEVSRKSRVKGEAVPLYKPFKIDLKVENRDSILLSTEYLIMQPTDNLKQIRLYERYGFKGQPIHIKTNQNGGSEFYYKSKSGLKTVQANWEKNVPKDVVKIKSVYKNEKWLNNVFKIQEKNYTVVEQQMIMKKEK